MRSSWSALHDHLHRAVGAVSTHTALKAMKSRQPSLARHPDPAGLIDALWDVDGDPNRKNDVLGSLVLEAQSAGPSYLAARDIIHLALWPGLDAVYRRRLRHFGCEADALAGRISELFLGGVARLDLRRVNRIAATLVRNADRDVGRDLQRRYDRERLTEPIEEHEHHLAVAGDPRAGERAVAELLASLATSDADLVRGVAVEGLTQREAADRLGVSHDAARKRYQRATQTLRQRIAAPC